MDILFALLVLAINTPSLSFAIAAIRKGDDLRAAAFISAYLFGCLIARRISERDK